MTFSRLHKRTRLVSLCTTQLKGAVLLAADTVRKPRDGRYA